MKKLNEKYYLDTDAYNYILVERSIVHDKKSKNYGKETFKNVAYFSTLEGMYNEIIEREIKLNPDLLYNLQEIIKLKKEIMGE